MSETAGLAGVAEAPVALRAARRDDLNRIVEVHLAAFHGGFTMSALGPAFLRQYYDLVLQFDRGILLVAEVGGVAVGFAAGFLDARRFYRTMVRNKWRFLLPAFKGVVRRPQLLLRLAHLVPRVLRSKSALDAGSENACELSSIAVDPRVAGKGVGKALVRGFADAARAAKAREVYLTTDALNNDAINAFYSGLTFQLVQTFEERPGRPMNKYVLTLHAEAAAAGISPAREEAAARSRTTPC